MAPRHPTFYGRGTRLFHLFIALAVIAQLATSLLMTAHPQDGGEDVFFEIHEYSGLASFTIISGFWLTILVRRRGTSPSQLFPWFSRLRRHQLLQSVEVRFQHKDKKGLLSFHPDDALAMAVHGLGIAIISAMAVTGLTYFLALKLGAGDDFIALTAISIHAPLSKLAWAFLVAHAGTAVLHAFRKERPLAVMWPAMADSAESEDHTHEHD